ncbi:MAG: VOC family protein [Rhodobacter sp.]|nr:VOC family protein [Rhodobacter sp.]
MTEAILEHANITVSDPAGTAAWLCEVFGWKIRWQGAAINGGHTVHVGGTASYLALYAPPAATAEPVDTYSTRGGLNHVALVVDDLDATEARVKAAGYTTGSHADYEPGRRFYFDAEDGVEFEIVSYSS